MSKTKNSFNNRDKFIQLGIAISSLRKYRGMSQQQLAEKAYISRSHLSAIEAPNMSIGFSLNTLFNIADALDVPADKLINTSLIPEKLAIEQEYPVSDNLQMIPADQKPESLSLLIPKLTELIQNMHKIEDLSYYLINGQAKESGKPDPDPGHTKENFNGK